MLWYRLSDSPFIFIDTFFDISQICLVTKKNGTWMHCAIHIPKKFSNLQQNAELFGSFKLLVLGFIDFKGEFTIISDSAGALFVCNKPNMASKSPIRNRLMRKMIKYALGQDI